jgi:hypothetical protein
VKGGESIYEVDITNSTATQTKLFDLPIRGGVQTFVSGDIYYNPYTGRYIITYQGDGNYYLGEFESDGTIWNETEIGAQSITKAWGLFSKDQQLYLGNSTLNGADIYTVNMTNLTTTFYNSITLGQSDGLSGSAQSPACEDSSFTRTPTPTPTDTPASTPTGTVGTTPTQTPTPSITPPLETCAFLTVRTDGSLDVPITGVEVNSVPVTYLSGTTFTIDPSDAPGYFNTTQTGASETVVVNYGSNIAGQRIELTDCDAVTHCCDLNPGGGTCTFTGVDLSCNCNWEIQAYDGTC